MKQLASLAEICHLFKPGTKVVLHSGAAEPPLLAAQLTSFAHTLHGVWLYALMPMGDAPYASTDPSNLRLMTFLAGRGLRQAVNTGRAEAIRVTVAEIAPIFRSGRVRVDVLMLHLSAPNSEGVMSLGVSVDFMHAVLEQNPIVVAEVNPLMPFTSGNTLVRPDQVDFFIPSNHPPLTMEAVEPSREDRLIAQNVSSLVTSGSILEIGIGAIPDQVLGQLTHLRRLGVHSGIITDAFMPLYESGAITNETKKALRGRSVTAMAAGSQKFYDFLNRNADIEFHSSELTHSFDVLKAITGLTAINSVLQIDLSGNANAEQLGRHFVSSPGGLPDFVRGASAAENGCSIIALRSTTKDGARSNILPRLPVDCPVIATQEYIDYVVTEYGVAHIRGLSPARRADQLITIAHPDFRQELRRAVQAP